MNKQIICKYLLKLYKLAWRIFFVFLRFFKLEKIYYKMIHVNVLYEFSKRYIFSKRWFDHSNHEYLLSSLKGKPSLSFLEIGGFEGMSSVWYLENILTNTTSHHTIIENVVTNTLLHNISFFKDQVTILNGTSNYHLKKLAYSEQKFDFIYIDGGHYPFNVLSDAVLSLELLKPGGIILFDDYNIFKLADISQYPEDISFYKKEFVNKKDKILKFYKKRLKKKFLSTVVVDLFYMSNLHQLERIEVPNDYQFAVRLNKN